MVSPLGAVLANIFMCDFGEKWFMNAKISPSIRNRHVDDTFIMFNNEDSVNEFLHYLQVVTAILNLPLNWTGQCNSVLGRSSHT